jgi:hypothetical protein
MENLKTILSNYLIFVIVFALCLVVIFAFTLYYGSKSAKKSIYLYGMFMDYKTPQIWALTMFIMQFLLLGFFLITKKELSIGLIVICMLFTIIGSILSKSIINVIMNTILEAVNLAIIYFGSLVNTLRVQVGNNKYLFLQIAIMFAGLLFYVFTTFIYVKNIRKRDKINAKA